MTNCPLVEYLDGYKVSLSAVEGLTCADTWLLDLRDWERFNATCTKLREFHWVVAPFGDPYFRVFGEYVKPQLKKLSFGVGIHWNWRWYFHDKSEAAGEINGDWDKQAFCARSGYGNLATDAKAALKGCPMLDELQIQLYHPNDIYPLFDSGDGVPLTRELVDHEMINAEVFGDPFCEALASYCHFLSHFSIVEVAEEFNTEDISPIQAFTDRGLMALSRLKYLQSLDLRSVNCSGEGVLGFLNSLSSDFTGNRTFEIRIGGIPHESRLKFYDVVKELLVKIAQASDLPCADRKFVLRLENVSYSSPYAVTRDYSASFFRELERLMTRVKAAHPSLRQHVVTMERNDTLFTRMNFMRVAEFGLYSVNADPRIYAEWEDWGGCLSSEGITMANREADDNEPSPVESRHMYCSGYDSYDGYDYYM
ncbi:hypothetical protein PR001_g9172 [Phytophthora rubi]|nr:hypothetical protein PR001_g9172 [Phytophthora rubi]